MMSFLIRIKLKLFNSFNSTSRYLDGLLNIDYPYLEGMVNLIYPPKLQLNKANNSKAEALFVDLHLKIPWLRFK